MDSVELRLAVLGEEQHQVGLLLRQLDLAFLLAGQLLGDAGEHLLALGQLLEQVRTRHRAALTGGVDCGLRTAPTREPQTFYTLRLSDAKGTYQKL